MNKYDAIQSLSQWAVLSEYFLQVTIDKTGLIVSFDNSIGPNSTFLNNKEKPIHFTDYFVSSDWAKYESQRIKASKNSRQSFIIDLQKIVYPHGEIQETKWEFFFATEDFGTCMGLGHPATHSLSYNMGLGDFFDSSSTEGKEIIESILENKLLGFWEFDLTNKGDKISQGLGQMLGYSQDELTGANQIPWQKHIHSDDFPDLLVELRSHFRATGNLPFKKEFRINQKNNQTIWALGFGKTIEWSATGHPTKVLGCILDISDRKKQEIWLKEHHYFLKELAFEQSHMLRARVANILGILEIMDSEPQNDESKRMVQIIKNETILLDQALKKSIKTSVQKNKLLESNLTNMEGADLS